MDVVRLLNLLRPHLEACEARWMLAGGFALVAWGSTRATTGLDLIVDEAARTGLLERLTADGFESLFDSEGFTNLLHPDRELGRLNLIWVEGETSRRLFAAARQKPLPGGLLVRVPAPEHLVEMKVKAIRSRPTRIFRDGEDLRVLLGIEGMEQNAAREAFVRAGLVELWELLHT